MQRSTTTLAPCLLMACALTQPLAGQGFTLAPFTAIDQGLQPAPRTVGLAATVWSGPVGFRVGGAMDVKSSPIAPLLGYPPADATRAWSADGDLVLSGARAGLSILGLSPSVFTGFGVHGRRRTDGSTANVPAWSYGLGASVPLTNWLSLDGEARYRMPHESDARLLPADAGGGFESRIGLAFHLGGTTSPRPAARRAGTPTTIHMGGSSAGSAYPSTPARRTASGAAVARNTLDTADDYVGVPYLWGGDSPRTGFDCSGFVQYVFARNGIRVPRVSRDQARAGEPVRPVVSALLPGDLMFYAGSDGVVDHVAIYAGDNRIIHSSSSGRGVRYDDLSSRRGRYYATRMVAARRVIPADGVFFAP